MGVASLNTNSSFSGFSYSTGTGSSSNIQKLSLNSSNNNTNGFKFDVSDVTTNITSLVVDTSSNEAFVGIKPLSSEDRIDIYEKVGGSSVSTFSSMSDTLVSIQTANNDAAIAQAEFYKKVGCSVLNTCFAAVEGILDLADDILDAGIIVVGLGASIVTLPQDGANFIAYKMGLIDNYESKTKGMWTEVIMPATTFEIGTEAMDALYSTKFMTDVNKNAYGAFQRADAANGIQGGAVYEGTKAVSYYAGQIALATATGGVAGLSSNAAIATVMGISSLGKNASIEFNALKDDNGGFSSVSGGDISKALAYSGVKATIDAGIYYAAGAAKDVVKAAKGVKAANAVSIAIKSVKPTANAVADYGFKRKEINMVDVAIDTGSIIVAESAAIGVGSLLKKVTGSSEITKAVKGKSSTSTASTSSSNSGSKSTPNLKSIMETSDSSIKDSNISTSDVTEKTLKNIDKLIKGIKEAGTKSVDKGFEKTVKETSGTIYDMVTNPFKNSFKTN